MLPIQAGHGNGKSNEATVLIASEDPVYLALLDHLLATEGFTVLRTSHGNSGSMAATDLVVLDCGSPTSSTLELLNSIKAYQHAARVPLLLLTDDESAPVPPDGAEVLYVCKSAGASEIVAGVRRALRDKALDHDAWNLDYAGIKMDTTTYRVRRGDREIRLTRIEFLLLRHLLSYPEYVFTRQELMEAAWPQRINVESRTVDIHVARLRRALGTAPSGTLIRTVRGIGYSLADRG